MNSTESNKAPPTPPDGNADGAVGPDLVGNGVSQPMHPAIDSQTTHLEASVADDKEHSLIANYIYASTGMVPTRQVGPATGTPMRQLHACGPDIDNVPIEQLPKLVFIEPVMGSHNIRRYIGNSTRRLNGPSNGGFGKGPGPIEVGLTVIDMQRFVKHLKQTRSGVGERAQGLWQGRDQAGKPFVYTRSIVVLDGAEDPVNHSQFMLGPALNARSITNVHCTSSFDVARVFQQELSGIQSDHFKGQTTETGHRMCVFSLGPNLRHIDNTDWQSGLLHHHPRSRDCPLSSEESTTEIEHYDLLKIPVFRKHMDRKGWSTEDFDLDPSYTIDEDKRSAFMAKLAVASDFADKVPVVLEGTISVSLPMLVLFEQENLPFKLFPN